MEDEVMPDNPFRGMYTPVALCEQVVREVIEEHLPISRVAKKHGINHKTAVKILILSGRERHCQNTECGKPVPFVAGSRRGKYCSDHCQRRAIGRRSNERRRKLLVKPSHKLTKQEANENLRKLLMHMEREVMRRDRPGALPTPNHKFYKTQPSIWLPTPKEIKEACAALRLEKDLRDTEVNEVTLCARRSD